MSGLTPRPRLPKASRMTRTTVCRAIPPRMLPTATSRLPDIAADTVMAISGRLVATASTMSPPRALPRCSRASRTSVAFESWMPATHTTAAAATKMTTRRAKGNESTHRSDHRSPWHPMLLCGGCRGVRRRGSAEPRSPRPSTRQRIGRPARPRALVPGQSTFGRIKRSVLTIAGGTSTTTATMIAVTPIGALWGCPPKRSTASQLRPQRGRAPEPTPTSCARRSRVR